MLAMPKDQAIEMAIEALYAEADDTYQQDEIDGDPGIRAWRQKRYDAIDVLEKLKNEIA
jgi:hypothetical protein